MTISTLVWIGSDLFIGSDSELYSLESSVSENPAIGISGPLTLEFRVRFPSSDNDELPPTQLSGSIVTLRNSAQPELGFAIWYSKEAASAATGNVYLTSSAGRLQLTSASVFDDEFYNLSLVRNEETGSVTLRIDRCVGGELVYSTSSFALSGSAGYPYEGNYNTVILGYDDSFPSYGEFWGQELRLWNDSLTSDELVAHAAHFESYGREESYRNAQLIAHWRLNEGYSANGSGEMILFDSAYPARAVSGSAFIANQNAFTKFLLDYAYVPSIDYGWNQQKVRVFSGSVIDPRDAYQDERFVSLEFNLYDALNEDISHVMSSYEELNNFIGLPVNKYREEYEGLQQMRETYFKRLQGQLNFRVFVDMLDFFDSSFVSIVERLMPARSMFKGDELVVESHMLERPKYQYQLRPVNEGRIDISGSIAVVDRDEDFD